MLSAFSEVLWGCTALRRHRNHVVHLNRLSLTVPKECPLGQWGTAAPWPLFLPLPGEAQVAKSPVAVGIVWSLCLYGLERAHPWETTQQRCHMQRPAWKVALGNPLRSYGSRSPSWNSKNGVGTALARQQCLGDSCHWATSQSLSEWPQISEPL